MIEDLYEAIFNFDNEPVRFIASATQNDGKTKVFIFEPLNPEQSSTNYFDQDSYFYIPEYFINRIIPTDEFAREALLMIKMRHL